jgi:hypothetical protein
MRRRRALWALPALLAVIGCATHSGVAVPRGGVQPTWLESWLGPETLAERADAALRKRDLELGYRYLALIHILHPESDENHEQFPLAARVFRRNHLRHRSELGSVWVTSEPRFMFGWLGQFCREQEDFPRREMELFFIGMHYGMFRDYLAYAKTSADLSRWTVSAEEDNGIIESLTAVRSEGPSS